MHIKGNLMPLPTPVGRQIEVLWLHDQGHFVVLGTAGSGKTTLAVLRAAHLADTLENTRQKVLLVTFNGALVTYLRSLLPEDRDDSPIDIRTYHHFARGYLHSRGRMRNNAIVDGYPRETLISRAVNEIRAINPDSPLFRRPQGMFFDEVAWISKSGTLTVEEYIESERTGRSAVRLTRSDRPLMFEIYERYKALRSNTGYDYDWDDLAIAVADEFSVDTSERMYRHVVIDEGQDFSPVMLRSLVKAIPNTGSLTFFGDVAQQIYGTRVSWRSAGLNVQRVWPFEENYRNSRQIAQLAVAISQMPYYRDESDLVVPREPRAEGQLPTIVKFASQESEFPFVVEQAIRLARTRTVAVLLRDHSREEKYISAFNARSIAVQRLYSDMSNWEVKPGIAVGTYHSAKGLEFDAVILPYCTENILPNQSRIATVGVDEARGDDGRLLYVAVTRARRYLIFTYSGILTTLLPTDRNLYEWVNR
jgi:superfamily I DNA/RNA helicase